MQSFVLASGESLRIGDHTVLSAAVVDDDVVRVTVREGETSREYLLRVADADPLPASIAQRTGRC